MDLARHLRSLAPLTHLSPQTQRLQQRGPKPQQQQQQQPSLCGLGLGPPEAPLPVGLRNTVTDDFAGAVFAVLSGYQGRTGTSPIAWARSFDW